MTVSPAGKEDLINRIDASRQRKMRVVGRRGLAAPILMMWKEMKEIREEGHGG
jgi:hypothetical protein